MVEEWREVVSDSSYEVSALGRVRSKDRMVKFCFGKRFARGKVLKTPIGSTGYPHVSLSYGKMVDVHVLVAEAFIGKRPPGAQVNHKNGDRADPSVENLEWVTPSENVSDGYARGRESPTKGRFGHLHPTSKPIVSTDIATGETTMYPSAMDAVRAGFDSSCISRCCAGSNAHHKGRTWRFAQ